MDFKCTHCGRWNRFTILRESAGIAEIACTACGRMMALGVDAFSDRVHARAAIARRGDDARPNKPKDATMSMDDQNRTERLQARAASLGLDLVHAPYGGTLKRGVGYSLHKKGGGDERRVAGGRSSTLDDIEGYLDGNAPSLTRAPQGAGR